jgi:DNA-binding beta-propeller fold protein YncE
MGVAAASSRKRLSLLFGLALSVCAFTLAFASNAQAGKLCCGIFPPEPPSSIGTQGEQFGQVVAPGNNAIHSGISGIAVNVEGNGPGVTPGDIYVVDKVNNRVQQLHKTPDAEGRRFVRAFGLDVGGAGVNVCTVAASCQAATASAAAGGMNEPIGVAVDQVTGNLYVSDNVNHRIDVFRADGVFEGAFGWKVNASAPAEELQFCSTATGCQVGSVGGGAGQFGERGAEQELLEIGEQRSIGGLAVAPAGAPNAGNLVIADSANNRVDEFALALNGSGEVTAASFALGMGWGVDTGAGAYETCTTVSICQVGVAGGGIGQFTARGLTRVAVDSTGAIYAINRPNSNFKCNETIRHCHVQKRSPAGTWSEFSLAELNRTIGNMFKVAASEIAVDPGTGDVYVARPNNFGERADYQILRFNSLGNLIETYRPGTQGIGVTEGTAFGLALNHADGNVYLSSTTGGQRIYLLTEPPPIPATVVTGAATSGANFSLMNLAGMVNPEGFKVFGCHFEYGTTIEYGTSTPCVPSEPGEGTGPVAVSAETEPLDPNTTYHYRLVADNGGPLGLGEDRTFTTGPAPTDNCPNAARRAEQGIVALVLPDCMALEMVSPPQKAGQPARGPEVSADGSRVKFFSLAALGENPPGLIGVFGAVYVATRGSSGWQTESTVPAHDIYKVWASENNPSFTPDLSRWLGVGTTREQMGLGIGQAFEGGLGGLYQPLGPPLVPFASPDPNRLVGFITLQGASADHTHLYFKLGGLGQGSTYFPGDPNLGGPGAESGDVYLARSGAGGEEALELLGRDRDGKVWGGNCGARLGGFGTGTEFGERTQGAISADGSRTYFSARSSQPASGECSETNKLRILERTEGAGGAKVLPLFTSECSRPPAEPCSGTDGNDLYQGASVDGGRVFFTTNRQLADSDRDGSSAECSASSGVAGCDLYLYDRSRPAGERLVQVSAGEELGAGVHEKGKEAKVYNGTTGISGDGSHVYFVAAGVLTNQPNPAGASAQAGQPNLYLWDAASEATSFIGTLRTSDQIVTWGGAGTLRNGAYPVPVTRKDSAGKEVGGDGHILLFKSNAELTAADADGTHRDLYRYDSAAEPPSLQCLSCRPGGPDSAPSDVELRIPGAPAGTDFAEENRWASEDGETSVFLTPEALVPGDVNGADDFYLWRHGALTRLPGKPYAGETALFGGGPFLSHDGSEIAYGTPTQLLPQDGDAAADIYVARVGGGFPNPPAAPTCEPGSGCQQTQARPAAPKATSEAPGAGNPKPKPRPCPQSKVRRKGRCVPRHTRKHRAEKRHRSRHASADRRAGK